MPETYEQYTARILSYVEGRDIRRILESTPRALKKKIAGASRRRLTTPPAKGKWSAGQILAHLSELELLWGYRIRMILERNGVEIVGMDQDVWARNQSYERLDPKRSLDTFRAIRQANIELLDSLTPQALKRRGTHTQFGSLTISKIFRLMAGHDLNHSRQIDVILKKNALRS